MPASSPDSEITWILGTLLIVYVAAMFGISLWARGRITNSEDFLVAGRRLPLGLAWATLFATWFGAGTLLTATDEVAVEGLRAGALDPIGAGFCLLIAGAWFARRLWNMKLLTLADFFRRRYGPRTELIASWVLVPGYFGWIAAQFVALATVLHVFFGIDVALGIFIVAVVGTGYTLLGGMWSVTLTDAFQMVLIIAGLGVLSWEVLAAMGGDLGPGGGLSRLFEESAPGMTDWVPTATTGEFVGWLGLFAAGTLGNLPGQDLFQRVFAAKSGRTAQLACYIAGGAYLTVGLVPLLLGLAGPLVLGDETDGVLSRLAEVFLSPALAVIFLLSIVSVVLSTIDSAILSPASVLAQNLMGRIQQEHFTPLQLNRLAILIVAASSLGLAYIGESAYELVESAYELGVVSLLVPLVFGVYSKRGRERAAVGSMLTGTLPWLVHLVLGWEYLLEPWLVPASLYLPTGLTCASLGMIAFVIIGRHEEPIADLPGVVAGVQ